MNRISIILLLLFFALSLFPQHSDKINSLASEEKKTIKIDKFFDNLSLRLGTGLTNYSVSGFEQSNSGISYELAILKRIDKHISILSQLNIMSVKGKRNVRAAVNSNNSYNLYEGNGDYFDANMTEISFVFCGDLPQKLLSTLFRSLNESFVFPKKLNINYNVGIGMCNFSSMRYNSISNSYIYGYGYRDEEGEFESRKSFWDLPKSRVLLAGISLDYEVTKNSRIYLSFINRFSDTPYIDSDKGAGRNDYFSNTLLGYTLSFDSL